MDGEGLEPSRCEPYAPKAYASTNSAIRPFIYLENNVGHVRLELTTLRLRGTCNACQAHSPYVNLLYHISRSKGKVYDGKLLCFVLTF